MKKIKQLLMKTQVSITKSQLLTPTIILVVGSSILMMSGCKKDLTTTTTNNTSLSGTIADIDGNVYNTVVIGTQTWMMENLKTTHYRNGDAIPSIADARSVFTGTYCNYNNDASNVSTYGRLYNWYAVTNPAGLCPAGWHIPTDDEWTILITYLGGDTKAPGAMKATGTTLWKTPNIGATNSSGFTALPGGAHMTGTFLDMGATCVSWSLTEHIDEFGYENASFFTLNYVNSTKLLLSYPGDTKDAAFSVRCLKD